MDSLLPDTLCQVFKGPCACPMDPASADPAIGVDARGTEAAARGQAELRSLIRAVHGMIASSSQAGSSSAGGGSAAQMEAYRSSSEELRRTFRLIETMQHETSSSNAMEVDGGE